MQAGLMLPGSVRGDSRREGARGREREGEGKGREEDHNLYTVMMMILGS